MPFQDRQDAGRRLATKLGAYRGDQDVVVLALPRGGVPVGYEIATALNAPLDVFAVRKVGVPGYKELAMGAVATGGIVVCNEKVTSELGISEELFVLVAERETRELRRRERRYRGDRPAVDARGRTAILVDDGLATGASMTAAVTAVRLQKPARVVIAVPVAALDTCKRLGREVEEIVCLETPEPFYAVGFWYLDFSQTSDDEVRDFLARAPQVAEKRVA